MNEAALRVCCLLSCVFWCVCLCGAAPLLPQLPPLSLLPLSVPVWRHGFQGLVAGRSDSTSALDPGLGTNFLGTLNFGCSSSMTPHGLGICLQIMKLRFDSKIVCGCGCVSAPKPFVPFSRSLNGSSLRSNLWFELRFSPETPNPFNTMKKVEPNNDNAKYNETQ